MEISYSPIKGLMLGFENINTQDDYLYRGSYLVIDFFIIRICVDFDD